MSRRFSNHAATVILAVLFFLTAIIPEKTGILYQILARLVLVAAVTGASFVSGNTGKLLSCLRRPSGPDWILIPAAASFTIIAGILLGGNESVPVSIGESMFAWWIVLAVTGAAAEESVFRFWLIGNYSDTAGPAAAVLVPSLLFCILHAWQGAGAVILAFLASILYGCLFVWRRNFWIPFTAHAIHNVLAVVLLHTR